MAQLSLRLVFFAPGLVGGPLLSCRVLHLQGKHLVQLLPSPYTFSLQIRAEPCGIDPLSIFHQVVCLLMSREDSVYKVTM